jgi:lysine 2,3-aminomutase
VLLAGINDDPEVLRALCVGLLDAGVTPYYLHHPDLTAGTQHLRVTLRRGLEITRSLRGRLSGLATPTYVIDVPRGGGKVPVDSAYVQPSERRERWTLISPLTGEEHPYIDLAERYSPQGQRRA